MKSPATLLESSGGLATETRGVLLTSFPKSGTYLSWRILRAIQKAGGVYRSFARDTGLAEALVTFVDPEQFPFEHYEEIDEVFPEEGDGWSFYIHHPKRTLQIDLELFLETASIVWVHEPPSRALSLGEGRQGIYLMRDGRAVVNSLIHHVTRPSVVAIHPTYTITDPAELYRRPGVFRNYVEVWRRHVEDFKEHRESYELVRFEDLTRDMPATIERLSRLLDVNVDAHALAQDFQFDRMKASSPTHVRAGSDADWQQYYTPEHTSIFKEVAGDLLVELGYEDDLDW